MSLPLSRRIARVALLVAAGAAPVIGAAGAASAADLKAPELTSGLSTVDGANLGNNIDATSHKAGAVTSEVGHKAVNTAVPATTDTLGKAAKTTTPAAQKVAGDLGASAAGVVGDTAKAAPKGGAGLPSLPTKGLPIGG
ncbi:ATP-binding protein [Streptomyces sp. ISL-11]|uniref:ATP-binding protein n=1 Tax=Streptomyces sp. ISL-11 TaxID=2819174 RepID=UPI001BE5E834|nr:ATP-binding protein [Streptomyces sp. ISL-11]MBT2386468.1 ATP-binding protein [Streptomyces sp. ISL-11]